MPATAEQARKARRGFAGPAWRWELARALARRNTRALARQADERVLQARDYLRACGRGDAGKQRASRKFPHLAGAEQLAGSAPACDQLKVLVLGDCPRGEIAERLQVAEEVIEAWEDLFFDVRASRGALDWVMIWVIGPEERCGNSRQAAKLKFAWAGPHAARAALDAESRIVLSQGADLVDRKLRLYLKFDEVMQAPLDSNRDKLFFIKMHAELIAQEQKLRLAERRLEQRGQEALGKQQLAQARLDLRAKYQQQRIEVMASRASRYEERDALRLRRDAEAFDRACAREDRLRAGKERAATSALAQLRWGVSDSTAAEAQAGRPRGIRPAGAEEPSPPPENPAGAQGQEPAAAEAGAEEPWSEGDGVETEEELCVA